MSKNSNIHPLLYDFIEKCTDEKRKIYEIEPQKAWTDFYASTQKMLGKYQEIYHEIKAIIRDIKMRDSLKCQYCRIDEGFYVDPPIRSQDLCKRHRQEYEEQYIDKTLLQANFEIIGKEGMSCGPPPRGKHGK